MGNLNISLPPYNKPHASADEIVGKLQSRGLNVPDSTSAAETIGRMGYMRLRMYLESRIAVDLPNRPFRSGVNFEDILRICDCDSKLRAVCFEAVGKFEISFRNTIAETLSEQTNSHPQNNPGVFKTPQHQEEILNMFTEIYENEVRRDGLAREYSENYSSPELPPIWHMKEMMTFGETVKFFKSLNGAIGTRIAKYFGGVDQNNFQNWLNVFIDLRNICAHHDRLFNRTFQKSLKILKINKKTVPPNNVRDDKLAGILKCLDHVMDTRGDPVNIEVSIMNILSTYQEIELAEVGHFNSYNEKIEYMKSLKK